MRFNRMVEVDTPAHYLASVMANYETWLRSCCCFGGFRENYELGYRRHGRDLASRQNQKTLVLFAPLLR
jgi:hypothetical protein